MRGSLPIHRPRSLALPLVALAVATLSGCFSIYPSLGGGETRFEAPRRVDPADVALPDGYRVEAVATGLTFPSGIAFDESGAVYVTEAGYSYGEVWTTPRLLRLGPGGDTTVIATGEHAPWNGVDHHDGALYVAEGGQQGGGRILRLGTDGSSRVLVDGLPSLGDHHTNGPLAARDGWIYFGQGTATNSAVVGLDSYDFGWLRRHPEFHDVPCRDVVLAGRNFTTPNPLTEDARDRVSTGAYMPFGSATTEGQVVPGRIPCNGAIMRVRASGGAPELVAWGLRNPFGLAWSPAGDLYVTDNSYDARGSRPVFGTGDLLWRIVPGGWYGWPDFHASRPLTDADWFRPPGEAAPGWVLREHPGVPPAPAAVLGVHSSSNGLDFSRSPSFGYVGDAFIAQFGDMAPGVGKVVGPVGFKVIRVDVATGVMEDFAVNAGEHNGPASRLGTAGLERPVAVRFDPTGAALYVVDFGVMTVSDQGPAPRPGTGVVWRITRSGGGLP